MQRAPATGCAECEKGRSIVCHQGMLVRSQWIPLPHARTKKARGRYPPMCQFGCRWQTEARIWGNREGMDVSCSLRLLHFRSWSGACGHS